MPDARVAIDPSMAHHFRLDAWDALDDGGRLALGDHLAERLQAHGWDVPEPMTLGTFGPPDSPRSVLQWREPGSGMTFSLVPGGTFRPGYDEAQLARLAELRREGGGDVEEDEAGGYDRGEPGQTTVFGSEAPCDLRLKAPVEVPPCFMATELVRPALPGLRSVVRLPDILFEARKGGRYWFLGDAILFGWDQVEPVLDHYGWSLPTSAEFEWALRGGTDSLFYWGDKLPGFMELDAGPAFRRSGGEAASRFRAAFDPMMSASFDPERARAWPWCNRLGLAAMLPLGTWCAPSAVPGDPDPFFIVRGGAAYCYPWQGCGEWELLLNAAETRPQEDDDAALRPIIRLEAGA